MTITKPRILIVDDEQAIIDTIHYALETEGCEAHAAHSALAAQEILANDAIDLIILDIGLPDIDGLALLKRIREHSDIPVVFLTARSADIDKILGFELGGDDYVVKPFSPRELVARVKAVLRRSKCRPRTTMSLVWQIDDERRSIIYFGTPLDLSRYEYNLLKVFLKKPGQIFSRDQLMDLAWEEPETSMDRTIDAHIKNVRAKLKAIRPDSDPIITHRGIGYSLKETS